jgi:small nuclear ribonucleoprotein (snRNP)-like protein
MGKLKIDYEKLNAERAKHGVEKRNREQEENIGFFDMLNGKHVEAKLTSGEVITGILETNAYNRYDVMLRNDEGMYVVRKDVLRFVKLYLNREND